MTFCVLLRILFFPGRFLQRTLQPPLPCRSGKAVQCLERWEELTPGAWSRESSSNLKKWGKTKYNVLLLTMFGGSLGRKKQGGPWPAFAKAAPGRLWVLQSTAQNHAVLMSENQFQSLIFGKDLMRISS